MGFSENHQSKKGLESKSRKWVIAGITVRSPLKAINTTAAKSKERESCFESEDGFLMTTTPTARESKIPEKLCCPPAPRKRRPTTASSKRHPFNSTGGAVEFFIPPPDLESVFVRHVESSD